MKKLFILIAIIAMGNMAMAQCNPSFTYSPTISGNDTDYMGISFTNTTVFTPASYEQVDYLYNYGDGAFGYSDQHDYTTAGMYEVTLTMSVYNIDSPSSSGDSLVCSGTYSQQITVVGTPCTTNVTTSVSNITSTSATLDVVANTPSGVNGMTYAWDFGDGSTGSGASTSHTYTASGNYNVLLTATNGNCTYTNSIPQTVVILDCDTLTANFSYIAMADTALFSDLSSYMGGYTTQQESWDFGDGTPVSPGGFHGYAAAGTYNVTMTETWTVDSLSPYATTCTHSITLPVTVGNPHNWIEGNLAIPYTTGSNSGVKVWLIKLDSNIISAVDSVSGSLSLYIFNNEPNGVYLVKAALIDNSTAPGTVGVVPTYGLSSLYWSGAVSINHTGGEDQYNDIYMLQDTVTSGPGFVAGDVLSGAGKGTGAGEPVAGLLIYLRNTLTGKVVAFQYTDASGNYSFSNIALGSYDTYPEGAGYATTPYTFAITNSQTSVNNIDFRENASTMTITPITTGINNINATATRLDIYPNPASGQVTIQYFVTAAQTAHINITNVLGQKVYDAALNLNSGNGVARLNLSALAGGLYMVNITSDNNINYTKKLMIQR